MNPEADIEPTTTFLPSGDPSVRYRIIYEQDEFTGNMEFNVVEQWLINRNYFTNEVIGTFDTKQQVLSALQQRPNGLAPEITGFGMYGGKGGADTKPNKYSKATKKKIAKSIRPITKEEALTDYEKLKQVDLKTVTPSSRVGNKFVDFYTFPERIDTAGKTGLSYFDLLANKSKFEKKPYINRFIKYIKAHSTQPPSVYKIWKQVFDVYFSAINIYKPVNAMELYIKYKPKSILDFTMGWGGRLVGACALNVPHYIGIDLNTTLKQPYDEMVSTLKTLSTTKITLFFKDALDVDYSKLKYDMVFTSPPYYNKEIYTGTEALSKDDWDEKFYRPIFKKTYDGMAKGGKYCLNIPIDVYERIATDVLGRASHKIPLKKQVRGKGGGEKYKEFIYVWDK